MFVTGPGFQMAQKFIENIFEKHIDWVALIQNDDNYKNILQVKIQKEFKVTPDYMEVVEHSSETGYSMGVYLCLGQPIHMVSPISALSIDRFPSFSNIHQHMSIHGKVFIHLGSGVHKIKKKAEQIACEVALGKLNQML
jgi:dsRNA-specific ribonuclease